MEISPTKEPPMSSYRTILQRATDALDAVHSGAPELELDAWPNATVMSQLSLVGELRQATDALLVCLSGQLNARSPRDDSARNLSRQAGFASPTSLIAETAGINPAESAKLTRVAQVTASSAAGGGGHGLSHVRAAFNAGSLSTEQVDLISRTLADTRPAEGQPETEEDALARAQVEQALVELAPTVRMNDLKKACEYSRSVLSSDDGAATEAQMRAARSLRFVNKVNGMIELVWLMTPEEAALVRPGIDAGARAIGRGSNSPQPEPFRATREASKFDMAGVPLNAGATQLTQLRADAAYAIFDHAAGCTSSDPKRPSFHAVVRVDLEALRSGVGLAELDGNSSPVSAALARKLAAKAGIIPAVMGSSDVPLNLGSTARLFSPAQRTALINRDGACAWPGCESSVQFSDAHHLAWWAKDGGPTDIRNGIMLCSSHHHRIHDNGWQIEFDHPANEPDGTLIPWFIPPPEWIEADPQHRHRLQGGNPIRALERRLSQLATPPSASAEQHQAA